MIQLLASVLALAAAPSYPPQFPTPVGPQGAARPGGPAGSASPLQEPTRPPAPTPRGPGSPAAGARDRAEGQGSGGTQPLGGGPGWSQSAGSASTRPTPPPDPDEPPEAVPGGGKALTYYEVHIGGFGGGTQTGYAEDFMVYAPDQTKPRPLLVVFHKFGVGHLDAWVNTTFFQEAWRKGWHIVAPLSASGLHMGCQEGQQNTEKVLDWVMQNFNVNRDRIYGVGFSMGGGAVANFAARHLDHSKYTFAAIVDHTGGIAHEDTYVQSPSTQYIFDFWFGNGSPGSTDPFRMARACLLDFNPDSLVVDPTNNLARNLVHVPVKVTRASIEPLSTAYLKRQCDVFVSHLAMLGGKVVYEIVPYFGHSWNALDERQTVDWLGVHRLHVPTSQATLADGDRRYFHFDVKQDAPLVFTPFTWDVDAAQNTLTLSETANLDRLGVDLASAGLAATQPFVLNLSTADNLADDVALQGWPQSPTAVHRDGVQQFVNWTYLAAEQLLTIQEFDGTQQHQWVVTP